MMNDIEVSRKKINTFYIAKNTLWSNIIYEFCIIIQFVNYIRYF